MDFRAAENEDPALGSTWGAERTVRAGVLRALLIKAPQEEGRSSRSRSRGANHRGTSRTPPSATASARCARASGCCPS
ncbi:hypothetical protein NKH18_43775 [Streptomyces sp. M10(2022)]